MSEIFVNGQDTGYREDSKWWWNENSEDGFRIANPNEDYPQEYFATDHVSEKVVENYCNSVIRQYELLTGHRLKTIIEFGSGGGWFTSEFDKKGYDITGYEGSRKGIEKCCERGLYRQVDQVDFRKILKPINERYQIALCTEVAGHIESPFSSILVYNLINHADVIWWSSEEPNANRVHLHHPNEQPYKFWINLFRFYGYSALLLSDEIFNACERRGRYIFYNKSKFNF